MQNHHDHNHDNEIKENNSAKPANDNRYWKGLEQLVDSEKYNELAEKEFLNSPLERDDGPDGVARRDFLKLMGASLAMGAAACVRRPVQKIVPYSTRPPEISPGIANYYSSAIFDGGQSYGVLVKTREGRPVYVKGNPEFPMNKGALSARANAHVLSVYDPDRLKFPRARITGDDFHQRVWNDLDWDKMDELLTPNLSAPGLAILSSSIASPSTQAIINDFNSGFGGKHYVYDAMGTEEVIEANKLSYNSSSYPRYLFERAKMIVSIGSDFLGTHNSPVEYAASFAKSRAPGADMSKFVSFEAMYTLTGANADTRIRVKPSQYLDVVLGLAAEIVNKNSVSVSAEHKTLLSKYSGVAAKLGMDADLFAEIAKDLWANRGQSIVISADFSTRTADALSLQIATNMLNSLLGNDGKTIDGSSVTHTAMESNRSALANLIAEMNEGKISTLIIHNLNAAYVLPANSGFVEALKKVKTVIYSGLYMDETAELAHFVCPDHHALENWNDYEFQTGLYVVQQPTIRPIHNTRSLQSSLMNWAYMLDKGPKRLLEPDSWYTYLKNNWQSSIAKTADFAAFWQNLLQKGFYDTKTSARDSFAARSFNSSALSKIKATAVDAEYELVVYQKIAIGDGSLANIAWLQELPDPVTKITWDNYINVSLKTAGKLNLKEGDVLKLTTATASIELPVHIQVGQHDNVLSIAVGYGRTNAGQIANGVGKNAFALVDYANGQFITAGIAAKVEKTSRKERLACTQGHQYMEGRQIVVEATLAQYLEKPNAGIHRHEKLLDPKTGTNVSIWPKHEYKGYKWGMAVDQNSCIGCSACVVACQSENNIPVVGKKYVLEGREMQWLRIDRYYSGEVTDPDTYFQPMMCQHCDNASCETVCPVVATTHSPEGLNEMTYNRCVGTRYCSNNCPYKVRRFNWFNYSKGERVLDTPAAAYNPDVTVRSRGVMEKCTFCVQRISAAKQDAKDMGRGVQDGDIVTACQESCPTNAIVFGNTNDPESRVSKLQKSQRSYKVLEEINNEPAVQYLSKIRNAKRIKADSHHGEHA